jgi:hypothetical protein
VNEATDSIVPTGLSSGKAWAVGVKGMVAKRQNNVSDRDNNFIGTTFLSNYFRTYAVGRSNVILSGSEESLGCFTAFSMTFNCVTPILI